MWLAKKPPQRFEKCNQLSSALCSVFSILKEYNRKAKASVNGFQNGSNILSKFGDRNFGINVENLDAGKELRKSFYKGSLTASGCAEEDFKLTSAAITHQAKKCLDSLCCRIDFHHKILWPKAPLRCFTFEDLVALGKP